MKHKIFFYSFLLAGLGVMATSIIITVVAYRDFFSIVKREVRTQSYYIQAGIEASGREYLEGLDRTAGHRITYIAPDGSVEFDTDHEAETLDNHEGRPEILEAERIGEGENVRHSKTQREQTYYYAVLMEDGHVLRVSSTMKSVFASYDNLFWTILMITVGLFLFTGIVASFLTRKIVDPINEFNLREGTGYIYEELTPFAEKIKEQNRRISQQMLILNRQRMEFESITRNMKEGFLVLGRDGDILTYNHSMLKLLGLERSHEPLTGKSYLCVNRSGEFREKVLRALEGYGGECRIRTEGREFQALVNPVQEGVKVQGVVIVLLDITEKYNREQLRREFTANVSHELKTPLTSISGYAEIMMNGVAASEDVPDLCRNIYEEAQRLIALVKDLLFLSRLEETSPSLKYEDIDLFSAARTAVNRMEGNGAKKHISLNLSGESVTIRGIPSVLDEMLYNLVDNGVKYSQEYGSVSVSVTREDDMGVVRIRDNGIGIPVGEQERIFERFYRVDKSRSSAVEGTGLGLAIVKHGAALHQGKIELESAVNEGTCVVLRFAISGIN